MSTSYDSSMPQWKRELLQRRKCHLTAKTSFPPNNGISSVASVPNNGLSISAPLGGDAVSITPRSRQSAADFSSVNMVEERLCGASPADADSDSSEELQYGPGIVNKLKCKYLSLALRESRKARPTVLPLRRATSLDDLLDDNVDQEHVKVNVYEKPRTNRALGRGNESLKRARSVETLLRCDRKQQPQVSEVGSRESFNEDVVIDERPVPAPRTTSSNLCGVNQNNSNKPRRVAPLLADEERPPPDTVRSALRIFESSVRRARPLKPVGDVAVKVANYKNIISNAKKPAVLPKPAPVVVSVENIATVKPSTKPPVKIQPPTPVVYGLGSNMGLKPPSSPKNNKLIRTPPVSPKKQPMKNIILDTRENDRATSPRNLNSSPILLRTPSPTSPILLSPTADVVPQSPQSPLLQQPSFPLTNGSAVNGSPTRQVGVIRPMEPPENDRQKALEHEKNLRNARESNELNNHTQNNSWGSNKKSWHQQSENTMVFNFRNRKDVPDYIENDGLVMKTRRDKPKITNDPGFILLEGVSPNSSSDWDNEDDSPEDSNDDGYDVVGRMSPTPPVAGSRRTHQQQKQTDPACDIVFEGAYVIINGRSSLSNGGKHSNRSKLHIQFDDDTSTYEYPSEASLLEDTEVSSPVSNSSPGLIGSVNLASYTPVKSGLHTSGSTFELGVTRTSPTVTDGGGGGPKGDSASINSPNSPTSTATVLSIEGAEEMGEGCLRPASDDQTVAWSQEQDATDLLF